MLEESSNIERHSANIPAALLLTCTTTIQSFVPYASELGSLESEAGWMRVMGVSWSGSSLGRAIKLVDGPESRCDLSLAIA